MANLNRWPTFLAMLAGCLLLVSSLGAVAPEVRDGAKFFSPAALKKADLKIRDIYRQHQRDVLIETFAGVPADDVEKVKGMDAEQRLDYFLKWAKDRCKERVVNGVYVLICQEPKHLRVIVDEKEPHKFTAATRDALANALGKEFKEGRFDEGLEQALRVVEERLTKK